MLNPLFRNSTNTVVDRKMKKKNARNLDHIEELAEKGEISTKVKFEFLDELFEEHNVGNSGFEDKMMELCFTLCKTKEEWQYFVKKLGEVPTKWRKERIMVIQKKHLKDDEAYLKMRKEDLHYGMDYWDLIEFYRERRAKESRGNSRRGLIKRSWKINGIV